MASNNLPGSSPFPTSASVGGLGESDDYGSTGASIADTPSGSSTAASLSASTDKTLDRIVQGAHQAVDSLAAKAAPAVEKLKTQVGTATDAAQQKADQLSALQEEWVESARATVREHPLASLAAAVAIGVLISRVTSSR